MKDFSFTDTRVHRTFEFTAEQIASASSRRDGSKRWSTVDIFRTEAGNYVLVKQGHSLVDGETTRVSVSVSETPEGVIESAHTTDPDGATFLTNVARTALETAGQHDDALMLAYATERVA